MLYLRFLRVPGVAPLAVFSLLTRVSNGMLSLTLVLLTVHAGGSYARAGGVVAGYALGLACCNPLLARAAERIGARALVTGTTVAQVLALTGCVVVTTGSHPDGPVLLAFGVTIGAFNPPLGGIMRSVWLHTLPSEDLRDTAFAYESLVMNVSFVLGPLLATTLSTALGPGTTLLAAAGTVTVGCAGLVRCSLMRTHATPPSAPRLGHWLGPLRHPRLIGLLPVALLNVASIAGLELSLVAFAADHGRPGLSGLLIAVFSVGGVLGGLVWGARRQPGTPVQRLMVAAIGFTAAYAVITVVVGLRVPGLPLVLPVLLCGAGLFVNPVISSQYTTMAAVAPTEVRTEAFTWLGSLGIAGNALGGLLAGLVVGRDAAWGLLTATALAALAALLTAVQRDRWQKKPAPALPVASHRAEADPSTSR